MKGWEGFHDTERGFCDVSEKYYLGSGHHWMWDQNGDGLWEEHLTIEGSLMCVCSGKADTHGFIRDGKWAAA